MLPEIWSPIFGCNSMKKYDILTVFDTCVDLIVDLGGITPEFDQKEKLVRDFGLYLGGSACIFAAQCAKLGMSTTGTGVLGKDAFGELVKNSLSGCGVDISHLREEESVKTSLGIALNRGSDRSILTYDRSIQAVTAEMVSDSLLKEAGHLHIASYYLLGGLRPGVTDLLRRAKKLGLTTSLDTNWDPQEQWELPRETLELIDVFLPNENEIRFLSGCEELSEAIGYFLEKIPLVVVKLGEKGAMAITKERRVAFPTRKVKVADTVGAGDSFDGGFLYGYLNGYGLEDCLKTGIICGSENVARFGGCDGQADLKRVSEVLEAEF